MDSIVDLEKGKEVPLEETKSIDDISSILSGYKNVTKKDEPITQSNSESSPSNTIIQNKNETSSVGDVYKTGKKAGQPRKPRVTVTPNTQQTTLSGEILTGALFITLIDLCLPMIIAGLNNRFSKSKIKASDLYLTAKQKSELSPIADKVVKQFDFNANPNALLVISMIGIYGANFAMLKFAGNEKDNKEATKKTNQ